MQVEGDGEACASSEASAEAQATAFAKAIVDVFVEVDNGISQSSADAIAESLAAATAKVRLLRANCLYKGSKRGLHDSVDHWRHLCMWITYCPFQATASAYAEACTSKGFARSIQQSLSTAIAEPIAEAIVKAMAGIDSEGGDQNFL